MLDKTILQKNARFQAAAKAWLEKTNIESILSKFGEFRLEGSYSYGLMMSGDIDMYVITDTELSREKALMIFNEIVTKVPYFYGFKFNDFVLNQGWEGIPRGYCFNLSARENGEKWKFDIWFLTQYELSKIKNYPKIISELMDDQKRLAILNLKQYKNQEKLEVPSIKIYDAVLKKNVMNIDEFREYLKR